MKKKFFIPFFILLFIAASAIFIHIRLNVKEKNNSSYTDISSSDEEQNKTQTRADLIFLELLRKTLFGAN